MPSKKKWNFFLREEEEGLAGNQLFNREIVVEGKFKMEGETFPIPNGRIKLERRERQR